MGDDKLPRELKKGLVELSILAILSRGSKYGLQIIKELESLSGGVLKIKEGTLYPALHRMEARGLVKSEWNTTGSGNPRKYYALTDDGLKYYHKARDVWNGIVDSMSRVLGDENE
jgi:PadR family transcriptional regulator PadR